jgi:hypothetical protein
MSPPTSSRPTPRSPSTTRISSSHPHRGESLRDGAHASPRAAATSPPASSTRTRRAGDRRHPVDAIYSPVQRVRYNVEDTRVGQRTNYDKLIMEVWTDGTVTRTWPSSRPARSSASTSTPSSSTSSWARSASPTRPPPPRASTRSSSASSTCRSRRPRALRPGQQLPRVGPHRHRRPARPDTDQDLLKLRSFGRTSPPRGQAQAQDLDLDLGMELPEGYQLPATAE